MKNEMLNNHKCTDKISLFSKSNMLTQHIYIKACVLRSKVYLRNKNLSILFSQKLYLADVINKNNFQLSKGIQYYVL